MRKDESGLAWGIVNTSYPIASAQTLQVENCDIGSIDELNNGFHFAFTAAAIVAAVAAIVAFVAIKKSNAAGGGNKNKKANVAKVSP